MDDFVTPRQRDAQFRAWMQQQGESMANHPIMSDACDPFERRIQEKQTELREQKAQLIAYGQSKFKSGDWHAVQDAASDIREIDAKLEILQDWLV
jgi:hypothetical protein